VDKLLLASQKFFIDKVMIEGCEASGKCNVDQRSFKAYYTRWLAATSQLVPYAHDDIMVELSASAVAAVKTCTAGNTGTACGLRWTEGGNDGSLGVGEQMAVMEVIQSNLVDRTPGWKSAVKGTGTSKGDVEAGMGGSVGEEERLDGFVVTTADRVGAGFLTALMLVGVVGGSTVMLWSD
jgi:mannan endo-1,6-alpha-mannosidase